LPTIRKESLPLLRIDAIAYGVFEIPGGWMADRFGPRIIDQNCSVVVGVYGAHRCGF
jgi:hypothetical protein